MLHHRREADGERGGELADRRRPAAQPREHSAAYRVGERGKGAVEIGRIVKHRLKYLGTCDRVKTLKC